MGSIIHIKQQWNILVIGNYYVNYQNYQNLILLTSSDTKRTLMHLLLFTNSAQRELVSICTQSIHNRNWLSLPYILEHGSNLMNLSRVSILQEPVSIKLRLKSWNIEYNLQWNQPYLSRVSNLSHCSNSLNPALNYLP